MSFKQVSTTLISSTFGLFLIADAGAASSNLTEEKALASIVAGEKFVVRKDSNEDGFIDLNEYLTSRLLNSARSFDRADENGDGLIDLDEYKMRLKQNLQFFTNIGNDLNICADSFKNKDTDTKANIESSFAAQDRNTDGKIDFSEAQAHITEQFTQHFLSIDQDSNELLDKFELTETFNQHPSFQEARLACTHDIASQVFP